VLQSQAGALTVQDVAARAGLDRTVVHRLLKTLAQHGLAVEERGAFRLGPQTILLGHRYVESLLVRRLALPYLVELQAHDIAAEPWTANLSVPVGELLVVVERIWTPTTPLDVVLSAGDVFSMTSTAAGRAILAYYTPEQRQATLDPDDLAGVEAALAETREAGGIGLSRREAVPGVEAVAAVILSRRGVPVAAIAVSGVDLGEQLNVDSNLAHKLRRAAHSIGQMLS
jgi:DNA-binding IclR family transcriptional regulator